MRTIVFVMVLAFCLVGVASTASYQEVFTFASGVVAGANLGGGSYVSFSNLPGSYLCNVVRINTTLNSFYNENSTYGVGLTMNAAASIAEPIINRYPNDVKGVEIEIYDAEGHFKGTAYFQSRYRK